MSNAVHRREIWQGIRDELEAAIREGKSLQNQLRLLQEQANANRLRVRQLTEQDRFWSQEVEEKPLGEEALPSEEHAAKSTAPTKLSTTLQSITSNGASKPIHAPMSHGEMARQILMDAKRGLTVDEIIKEMEVRNHTLPEDATSRRTSVYSAMWRRKDVFYKSHDHWNLKE